MTQVAARVAWTADEYFPAAQAIQAALEGRPVPV